MTKNKVIALFVLLNILVFGLFLSERSRRLEQEDLISAEFLSVQQEVCTALKADDYDVFQSIAYRYEEISRVYMPDYGGWKAVEVFLNEEYFHAVPDDRVTVADILLSSVTLSENEKSEVILNAVNTAYDLYHAYQEQKNSSTPLSKPASALYELFDATGSIVVTLHIANDGAYNSYPVETRWFVERCAALMNDFQWTEAEMPNTEFSEYWITLTSINGMNEMTVWSGGSGMIQYDDGKTTTCWQAVPLGETLDSIANFIRDHYYNLDVDASRILFYQEGSAEKAANSFVHSAYGSHLLSLAPGNDYGLLTYEVIDWKVREISEDGTAVVGWLNYAFVPLDMNSSSIWAGNTTVGSGEYEGMLTAYREFVLEKQEDGYWHCIGFGTGGYHLPE